MRTWAAVSVFAALAGWAAGAFTWEVRLDLDTDDAPATINETTSATSPRRRVRAPVPVETRSWGCPEESL